MRTALTLTCSLAATAASAATLECRFTTECFDSAPCTATDYAFSLQTQELTVVFVTPSGSFEGRLGVTPDGATFAVAAAEGAIHLLTLSDAQGTTRYTTHLTGAGIAITYVGTCEDE